MAAEEMRVFTKAKGKPQEGAQSENNHRINLRGGGQAGSVVRFKTKRHTPLSQLMEAYCGSGFVNEVDQIAI